MPAALVKSYNYGMIVDFGLIFSLKPLAQNEIEETLFCDMKGLDKQEIDLTKLADFFTSTDTVLYLVASLTMIIAKDA